MNRGILAALTAAIGFGLIPVLTKTLESSQVDTMSLICGQCCFGAVFLCVLLKRRGVSLRLTKAQTASVAAVGIMDSGTMFLLYESYKYIEVGLATMAHFIYPVLVFAIMAVIFRERITLPKGVALVLAMAGMVIMVGQYAGNLWGLGLAVASGVCYAVYNVVNQKSAASELPALLVTFYDLTFLSVVFLLLALTVGGPSLPTTSDGWLLMFINALLKTCGCTLAIYAMQKIGSTRTSILSMIELVTAVVAGNIFFHEILQAHQIIGGLGILAGAVLVNLQQEDAKR